MPEISKSPISNGACFSSSFYKTPGTALSSCLAFIQSVFPIYTHNKPTSTTRLFCDLFDFGVQLLFRLLFEKFSPVQRNSFPNSYQLPLSTCCFYSTQSNQQTIIYNGSYIL